MSNLETGIERILELKVTQEDTANAMGSGNLDVYATPAMIAGMERCAMDLVQSYLEFGYTTVGTAVNIKHIKATPVGVRVNTVARLIEIDDKKLVFEVESYDTNGMIGTGTHNRYIINEIEFNNNL
ncbi:MAG: hypothetical protein B6I18_01075 [Bacteroidetes bacterium 4572_112]|nr:MAG: hypothetical protein B6I18_01075 [Bacteroidetes bacterium 4572_112]